MMKRIVGGTLVGLLLGSAALVVSAFSTSGDNQSASVQAPSVDLIDGTAPFEACMARSGLVAEGELRISYSDTGDFFTVQQLDNTKAEWEEAFVSSSGEASLAEERSTVFWDCAAELLASTSQYSPPLVVLPTEYRDQVQSCLLGAKNVSGLVLQEAAVGKDGHLQVTFRHDSPEDLSQAILTNEEKECLGRVEQAFAESQTSANR